MKDVPVNYRLRASVQRALLGEIDDRVVSVTCGIYGSKIKIRMYVDAPVTAADVDRVQVISSEVIADFLDEGYSIEEECLPAASGKPEVLEFWAFYRANEETS